jgi:DNA-binding MarR family transcriptional regulator
VLADGPTITIADLADAIGRSPSATSRLADGLVARGFAERQVEHDDRRQRSLRLTGEGQSLLAVVDRARADQFLAVVRPLPPAERTLIAMGVAALSNRAITRRGKLIKAPPTWRPADSAAVRRPADTLPGRTSGTGKR